MLLFALYQTKAKAVVVSPQVTCVSVLPNGNITVTWLPSNDPLGEFVYYQVYASTTAGSGYTQVGGNLTPLSTSSFTYTCGCGNTTMYYFYVVAVYNTGVGPDITSPALDTVKTIFLNVTPAAGIANLSWNQSITPPLASSGGIYTVSVEFPTGVWTVVGTTSNLNFTDTVYICNTFNQVINYHVTINDNSGCTSVSSVDGSNLLHNTIAPTAPILDTLSVDNNNNAMMNWNTSTSPDCAGYIIYELIGASWIMIDSTHGINSTNYTYTGLTNNANLASQQFRVSAYDSCGNNGLQGGSLKTIYLTTISDICNHSATLNWNDYPTIGTGMAGFRIYQSSGVVPGPYTYIGSVPAGVLTFTATGLTPLTTYYFKVESYDFSGTKLASSNRRSFFCTAPIPPNFLELITATVVSSSQIDVDFFVDTAASVLGYNIYRSTVNIPSAFEFVGFQAPSMYPLNSFSDLTVEADKNAYYYKVVNIDSCGFDGMESNIGRTMLLKSVGDHTTFTNTLTWNKYKEWGATDTTPLFCNIFRGIDGVFDTNPIAVVSFGEQETTYVDDVSNVLKGEGNFIYKIEAQGSFYGFNTTSFSNISTSKQESEVYIPNAFTPNGVNPIFKPSNTWVNYASYQLDIFNRFGENIFSTTKAEEGWDGTRSGNVCELGVYVYKLYYKTSSGKEFNRKGVVTLLR